MSKTIQTWSQEIRPGDKLPEGYDFASMMEDHYANKLRHYPEDVGRLLLANTKENIMNDVNSPNSYILKCVEWGKMYEDLHNYW